MPLGPFLPAYHFDQALVGRYLKAHSQGVEIVDNVLTGVERDGESGNLKTLIFEDGQRLAGDFFIDATGFRKRLIVGELNAPWISYQHELPVNRALPFWLPIEPGEEIANYTRAWAQEAGWMWQIPTQFRYGCGYVYSDEFQTPDQAHAEVERVLGRKIEVRSDIQFKIGRLEKAWIGNVLAVGLSSSFLEPLESTSIHGTIVQMMMFAGQYLRDPAKMTDAHARRLQPARGAAGRRLPHVREHPLRGRARRHAVLARGARQSHPPRDEGAADSLANRDAADGRLPAVSVRVAAHRDATPLPGAARAGTSGSCSGQGRDGARIPKLRSFAKATYDSLVREYKQAATQALGHAEFLQAVRDGATLALAADRTRDQGCKADQRYRGDAGQKRCALARSGWPIRDPARTSEAAGENAGGERGGICPELGVAMREHGHGKDRGPWD